MIETKALFFSMLLFAAMGIMCAEALVDQLPDPAGPVAVAYGN